MLFPEISTQNGTFSTKLIQNLISTVFTLHTMDEDQFKMFLASQQQFFKELLEKTSINTSQHPPQQGSQSTTGQNQTVNAALLPNFENFDSKRESFRNYKQRFENYITMKNISQNKEYCAKLLLNSIGAENFNIISALSAPRTPAVLTYDEIFTMLEKHLAPKRNILVAQHKFLSNYQMENQSIADYVATLRRDTSECQFICNCNQSIADIFLRAQFIRGIRDITIRENILQSETTAFDEIVTKALALEASKIDSRELTRNTSTSFSTENSSTTTNTNKVNQNHRRPQYRSRSKSNSRNSNLKSRSTSKINYQQLGIDGLCLRCGRNNHTSNNCHSNTSNLKCAHCNKTGHVAKVCIRTLIDKNKKKKRFN